MGAVDAHSIRVVPASEFRTIPPDVRRELLRDQHACGTTGEPEPGLIALAGDDAVAWIGLGLATTLVTAARDYALSRGASAVEGYPMVTSSGEITWGELFVGPLGAFTRAGFSVVAEPSKRRRVVRFEPDGT